MKGAGEEKATRKRQGREKERNRRRKGVQCSVQRLYPEVKYPDIRIPHCYYLENMDKTSKTLGLNFIIV